MNEAIKILILEDSAADVKLIQNSIKKAGLFPIFKVVDDKMEFGEAVKNFKPEVILCDHSLIQFNSMDALRICKEQAYPNPFILVTGTVSEEFAVECMRAGVDDYVLKTSLVRLPSAIDAAIKRKNAERAIVRVQSEMDIAYNALKISEGRYMQILETAQEGIWLIDEKNNTRFVNKKMADMLEYSPSEMIGKPLFYFLNAESQAKASADIAHQSNREATKSFEDRLSTKSGRTIWVHISTSAIFGEGGRYEGGLAMITDITERKMAELELQASEKKYRRIIETAQEGIWIIDENNMTNFANNKLCEILEYSSEEMMGKVLFDFMDEEGKKRAIGIIEDQKKGVKESYEFEFITKTKKRIWAKIATTSIYGDDGSYQGGLAMVTDITRKKNAEMQLKNREELYRSIVNTSQEGIWLLDEKYRTVFVNAKMCEMLEYHEDEMMGKQNTDFMDDRGKLVVAGSRERRKQGINEAFELPLITKTGHSIWVSLSAAPILGPDGKLKNALAMVTDITQRKLTEANLVNSEKRHRIFFEKSQGFLCTHDLKGNFISVNEAGANSLDYSAAELVGMNFRDIQTPSTKHLFDGYLNAIEQQKTLTGQMHIIGKNGEERTWIYNNYLYEGPDETYVIASSQDITDRIKMEKEKLNSKLLAEESIEIKKLVQKLSIYSNKIKDSINYSKRIQERMFSSQDVFNSRFKESFIINYPKEIVSGDFYWTNEKNGKIILALADCTGHGVPGALLSTLGYSMLNNIVLNENITTPDEILKKLLIEWKKTFDYQNKQSYQYDGMEIAVCTIDYEKQVMEFSALGGSMLLVKNGVLHEYKGEHIGTSGNYLQTTDGSEMGKLTSYSIHFNKKDSFYLFSDGYRDQFGGAANEKFTKSRFQSLINKVQSVDMKNQGKLLDKEFLEWKGKNSQIDDVLVIGVQL